MSTSVLYPNICQWFGPLLKRLEKLQTSEYVALLWELNHACDEEQYRRNLDLLEGHIALAAAKCGNFSRLIKERSKPGEDIDGANRMVLDKLAEIRAIAGLLDMGFVDIKHHGTPDLTVNKGAETFAVEVTRLAASPSEERRPVFALLAQGDGSEKELAAEIFNKVQAKQAQLIKSSPAMPHLIWVSLGRDYFTAGRYERSLTGLRSKMSRYASDALNLTVGRVRSELDYSELTAIALCLGRREADIVAPVK